VDNAAPGKGKRLDRARPRRTTRGIRKFVRVSTVAVGWRRSCARPATGGASHSAVAGSLNIVVRVRWTSGELARTSLHEDQAIAATKAVQQELVASRCVLGGAP
jgi:hypothetical protein